MKKRVRHSDVKLVKKNKKAQTETTIVNWIIWTVLFIIAIGGIVYLVNRLTG